MKLFYFNPNDYGTEAFVCANSKEEAIEQVKNALIEEDKATRERNWRTYDPILLEKANKQWDIYLASQIDNMCNEKNGYTIDEYPVGKVVFSEIC